MPDKRLISCLVGRPLGLLLLFWANSQVYIQERLPVHLWLRRAGQDPIAQRLEVLLLAVGFLSSMSPPSPEVMGKLLQDLKTPMLGLSKRNNNSSSVEKLEMMSIKPTVIASKIAVMARHENPCIPHTPWSSNARVYETTNKEAHFRRHFKKYMEKWS